MMIRAFTRTAALALCLSLSQPAFAEEAAPSEAALAFAGQFSDDQLSGMLSRIGGNSQAMIELSQLGGEYVARVFDLQIDRAVEKYSADWQRNMALAWQPLLTAEEMASILAEGAESPFSDKYTGLRTEAGKAMQASSAELFRTILTEVVGETRRTLVEDARKAPRSE